MKFKNLTATVAMVALLCGGVAAHAQTMSGKGIDISAASGYGAQLQLDEVKAQQVVNTAAITTQGEQLEDVNGRLDDIADQLSSLRDAIQAVQTTLTMVTTKTEALESVVGEGGDEDGPVQNVENCPSRTARAEFGTLPNYYSQMITARGTSDGGLSQVSVNAKDFYALGGYMTYTLTFRCQDGGLVFTDASSSGQFRIGGRSGGTRSFNQYCQSSDGQTCQKSARAGVTSLNVTVK
ncbi:MAG: hypothetical protein U0942_05605 [Parvibaculum sp.]|uniref:hypothetical protein n=1 Tax=Parvibaculum sp. TaxID=2024848 RepID=UPI002ABAEFDC|nr:hypothetical protein [Parvibaculum sp.]MDZ4380795.1 hypothetical protein [Parvibaculum sp.]